MHKTDPPHIHTHAPPPPPVKVLCNALIPALLALWYGTCTLGRDLALGLGVASCSPTLLTALAGGFLGMCVLVVLLVVLLVVVLLMMYIDTPTHIHAPPHTYTYTHTYTPTHTYTYTPTHHPPTKQATTHAAVVTPGHQS